MEKRGHYYRGATSPCDFGDFRCQRKVEMSASLVFPKGCSAGTRDWGCFRFWVRLPVRTASGQVQIAASLAQPMASGPIAVDLWRRATSGRIARLPGPSIPTAANFILKKRERRQARSSGRIGRRRMRLPVPAKMALQTAGAITGRPGSPMPVGSSVLLTT